MLIILSGNYNFFNLLTLALCLSLLDDQHVHFWLRKTDKTNNDGRMNINIKCIHTQSFHTLNKKTIHLIVQMLYTFVHSVYTAVEPVSTQTFLISENYMDFLPCRSSAYINKCI